MEEKRTKRMDKQVLQYLESLLAKDVGEFLVLLEEGNTSQIEDVKVKARGALLKYGPEMKTLSDRIGEGFPETVEAFLNSIDLILHAAPGWIDEAKIFDCYNKTERLEKELRKAA